MSHIATNVHALKVQGMLVASLNAPLSRDTHLRARRNVNFQASAVSTQQGNLPNKAIALMISIVYLATMHVAHAIPHLSLPRTNRHRPSEPLEASLVPQLSESPSDD